MCVGAIIGVWRRSEDSLVESALSSCLPWFSAVQLRSSGLRVNFYPQCSQALEPIFFFNCFFYNTFRPFTVLHDCQAACGDILMGLALAEDCIL